MNDAPVGTIAADVLDVGVLDDDILLQYTRIFVPCQKLRTRGTSLYRASPMELIAHILLGDHKEARVYRQANGVTIETANQTRSVADEPIRASVATLLGCDPQAVVFDRIQFYELPYANYWADKEACRRFESCSWSDMANDRIAFQCRAGRSQAALNAMPLPNGGPLADALQPAPLCACLRKQSHCVCG